jgi:hypothetical protein
LGCGAKVSQISQRARKGKERRGKETQGKAPIPTKQKHRLKTTTIGEKNCLVHPLVASCLQFLHKSQKTLQQHQQNKKQPSFWGCCD